MADDDNIVRLAALRERGSGNVGEDAVALQFAEQHASHLRYCAALGRWFDFDGSRWGHDDTLHSFDRARSICRAETATASAKVVAAIEKLARSDRRLAATAGQWDTGGWLMNTGDREGETA